LNENENKRSTGSSDRLLLLLLKVFCWLHQFESSIGILHKRHKNDIDTDSHFNGHFGWTWNRVGFLPAETCFCRTWGLNRFKPD